MSGRKRLRGHVRPILHGIRRSIRPPDYGDLQERVGTLEKGIAALLRDRYPEVAAVQGQRERMRAKEFKVHSQNGEDGLLLHIFSRIGVTDRRLVEIGFGDGRECNAANLILNFGWSGLMIDCVPEQVDRARSFFRVERGVEKNRLELVSALVDAENVNKLIEDGGIGGPVDLLSLDVDGNDYWIWKALDRIDPRVIVIEYNASLGSGERLVVEYDPRFRARSRHPKAWYHGASLAAMVELGRARGYIHVATDSMGVNAFFVKKDLAGDEFRDLDAAESYHPHRRRMRYASPEAQFKEIRGFPYVEV